MAGAVRESASARGDRTVEGRLERFDGYLERHFDELVEDLCEFIRIPGLSLEGGPELQQAVAFVAERLRAAGFATDTVETSGHPVLFGEGGDRDAPFTLLLYGHYDVFPAASQPGWDTPPFEPTLQGDRLFGRGAGDNKGQLLAHLHALRWLHEEAADLGVRLKFVVEGEEEVGSPNLPVFIRENRERLTADLCAYSDGPMFPGDQPVLLFGVRGSVCFELRAEGANRPLHSGNFGGVVPTPATDLARFVASLSDGDGLPAFPGGLDGVPEIGEVEQRALEALPLDLPGFTDDVGVDPLTREAADFHARLLCRPTVNLTGFGAGIVEEGIRTLIPNEAVAKIDIRLVGDQDPDAVLAAVEQHARAQGYEHIRVTKILGQPASRTPLDHPLADHVHAAVAEGFERAPLRVPSLGGTTPDYVFTKLLGIPSIVVPYAPQDERNHAPNESTKLSLYRAGMRTTVALVTRLAEHART